MNKEPTLFDRRMRQAHGVALQSLPPTTLARLRAARGLAARQHADIPHGRRRWTWLAAGIPAVLAIAIGVQQLPGLHDSVPAHTAHTATAATRTASGTMAVAASTIDPGVDALGESPEFYAWLGSDAAAPLD